MYFLLFSNIRSCKIDVQEKKPVNERNIYNHNFDGLYCVCNRPYPCEDYNDCEMLQCIICEDWFHLQVKTSSKSVCAN